MIASVAREIAKKNRQADKTVDVERILREDIYIAAYNGKTESMSRIHLKHNIKKVLKTFKNDGYDIDIETFASDEDNVEYIYKISW